MPYTISTAAGPQKVGSTAVSGGMGVGASNVIAAGAQFITNGVRKNDLLQITGSPADDGQHIIDRVVSENEVVTRSTFAGAAGGSITADQGRHTLVVSGTKSINMAAAAASLPDYVEVQEVSPDPERQPSVPVGSTVAPDRITAGTANFGANGVKRGHVSVIDSGANAGSRTVAEVISPTEIRVEQGTGDPPLSSGGAVGNVRVYRRPWTLYRADLYAIQIDSGTGGVASWWEQRAVLVFGRSEYDVPVRVAVTNTAGLAIQFGRQNPEQQGPNERRNASLGCGVFGLDLNVSANPAVTLCMYGTLYGVDDGLGVGSFPASPIYSLTRGDPGTISCSILDVNQSVLADGNTKFYRAIISSDGQTLSGFGGPGVSEQLHVADGQATTNIVASTITIEGFDAGGQVATPYFQHLSAQVTLLDPLQDFVLSSCFSTFNAGSWGRISYTWNPRFVGRDETTKTKLPLAGVTVRVVEINETTLAETLVDTYTTDASGRINSGAGVDLRARQRDHPNTDTEYSYRVTAGLMGHEFLHWILKPSARVTADQLMLPYSGGHLEGEAA